MLLIFATLFSSKSLLSIVPALGLVHRRARPDTSDRYYLTSQLCFTSPRCPLNQESWWASCVYTQSRWALASQPLAAHNSWVIPVSAAKNMQPQTG